MSTVDAIPTMHGHAELSKNVLQTESAVFTGHTYSEGMIILIEFIDVPEFAEISGKLVVDNEKFFHRVQKGYD
jgi:hypothetical protein